MIQIARSRRGEWLVRAGMVLISILIALASLEGLFRIRHYVKYGRIGGIDGLMRIDRQLGLRVLVPNTHAGPIVINSLGFRGPEIEPNKPPGTIRLAFLGASAVFCAEVSSNDLTWPHLATGLVRARLPAARFDYVNGGIPGYTVTASIQQVRTQIVRLSPDVIVIYPPMNDLSGELRDLAARRGLADANASYRTSWLAEHSVLWVLAEKNLRVWTTKALVSQRDRLNVDPSEIGAEFSKNFAELVIESRRIAKIVAVTTASQMLRSDQSPDEQSHAAAAALLYVPFMSREGLLQAYRKYNLIIRQVGQATGVPVIDVETAIPADARHFNDTNHFRDDGSRVMAAEVAQALLAHEPFLALVRRPDLRSWRDSVPRVSEWVQRAPGRDG